MERCNIIALPGREPMVDDTAYIDPMARILGEVTLGREVVVLFGAVVRGDDEKVIIGERSVVLENAIIEAPRNHPVSIGENVIVSHGAIIHGAVVESDSLIGIGAKVLDGAHVERGSIVAAGALVPPGKVVEAGTIVAGVPARPVRRVTSEDARIVREELESVHRKAMVYRRILPRVC